MEGFRVYRQLLPCCSCLKPSFLIPNNRTEKGVLRNYKNPLNMDFNAIPFDILRRVALGGSIGACEMTGEQILCWMNSSIKLILFGKFFVGYLE